MSVNTANTPDGDGVLIYNGEVIHVFTPSISFTFEKNENEGLLGKMEGQLFLTSHRIIFRPMPPKAGVITFEMPFHALDKVRLEQPIFGANYIHGFVQAAPGSNIRGDVPFRMTFSRGGCVEFGLMLLQAVDAAERMTRPQSAPPPYAPPAGAYYAAPPDYYTPSAPGAAAGGGGGQQQQHVLQNAPPVFSERPPADAIFMAEAPPPYPGVGEERAPQPTEELRRAGESAAPPPYSAASDGLRQRRA
ncbi:hypothetical protein PRIPAC_89476 [Pristionchus pacificus]|nr:hypothetical protein PRIPAC_89476 [Pristionchus pacificus]